MITADNRVAPGARRLLRRKVIRGIDLEAALIGRQVARRMDGFDAEKLAVARAFQQAAAFKR